MAGYEGELCEAATFWTGMGGRWFRTGDVGRLDADGYLYLSGRKKEMINRGGEKVWPREVEQVLEQHSAVQQAVVFAVAHAVLGEEVGAAIVLRPGEELTEVQLQSFAVRSLAAYQIPTRVAFVPAIHAGPGGKIQRARLASQLGMQPFTESPAPTVHPAIRIQAKPPHREVHANAMAFNQPVYRLGDTSPLFSGPSLFATTFQRVRRSIAAWVG